MRTRRPLATALRAGAALALALALPAAAHAENTSTPLPAGEYTQAPACRTPAPGHVGCLAIQLVPRTARAAAHNHPVGAPRQSVTGTSAFSGSYGLTPEKLHTAYALPVEAVSAQTVAVVDAYNDPVAEEDLAAYDTEMKLPACTTANGCFTRLNQEGKPSPLPFPATLTELKAAEAGTPAEKEEAEEAVGWGVEMSLDMETVRATCQTCKIILVEANSTSYSDLEAGVRAAAAHGATEISNSYGGNEAGISPSIDNAGAFNHPGIVITASAGDNGYRNWDSTSKSRFVEYPASSPHVISVGGTRLKLGVKGEWLGESVWNGNGAGGGGCSEYLTAQPWQQAVSDWASVGCASNHRSVSDISADADPYTGLAVYDSLGCKGEHWCTIGGTSLASPLIASVFALAGGAGAGVPGESLYRNARENPSALHDVTEGSNGECALGFNHETGLSHCTTAEQGLNCSSQLKCMAGTGYDGPTGLGTPHGIADFTASGEGHEEKGGEEPTEKEGGGEGTGGGKGTGGAPQPINGLLTSPPPTTKTGTPPPVVKPELGSLALSLRALVALNRPRPRASVIAFTFTSATLVRATATLAVRARVRYRSHGRTRTKVVWKSLPVSVSMWAYPGADHGALNSHRVLPRGSYRLTLSAAGVRPQAALFSIL